MDFLDAIRRDSDLFYAAAEAAADPSAKVPSCPDWTIADLVWHLGEVHWFWATDIEQRATDPAQLEGGKPSRPDTFPELVAWGRSQVDHLIGALESTPDDVRVWTWALGDDDHTVGFIRRHQVQEAAVHRWDMQTAAGGVGSADPIDVDAAVDSIDEFLSITLPWCVRDDKPLSGSVHLHCVDTAGEWFIAADGSVERAHSKADVAIRGTASDLLLALFTRIPLDRLDVVGDASVASELFERVDTT